MKTSVRELRSSMKRILYAVQHGEEVMIYSHDRAIAKIVPLEKSPETTTEDYGFGMWKDYPETSDVGNYLRNIRKGRRHDV